MNYLKYWNLNDKPFDDTRNPKFFFESSQHAEALGRFYYLVEDGNMRMGLLTGEIGSGKTLTATVLRKTLNALTHNTIFVENSNFTFTSFLKEILCALRRDKEFLKVDDSYILMREFKDIIREQTTSKKKNIVLILDEAQQLPAETLELMRNLTNIDFEDRNCVTIILVGQPELRLMVSKIPQLNQRIALRFHLNPLASGDISNYLAFRLRRAGHSDGEIFDREAAEMIYRETGGVPRNINRVARLSLDHAFAIRVKRIPVDVVKSIFEDIRQHEIFSPS